jgi:hypothetical protein
MAAGFFRTDKAGVAMRGKSTDPSKTPVGETPSLADFHAEFADFEEGYVRSYIALADTKAAWSFTIASAMLAFLFGQETTKRDLLAPACSVEFALLLGSAALLTVSAFYSFRVVAPRLRSPSGEGIIFFGAVASQESAATYVEDVAAKDKRALTEARLKHCYDISRVCDAKYKALKGALWLGVLGLALAIAYLLLG